VGSTLEAPVKRNLTTTDFQFTAVSYQLSVKKGVPCFLMLSLFRQDLVLGEFFLVKIQFDIVISPYRMILESGGGN